MKIFCLLILFAFSGGIGATTDPCLEMTDPNTAYSYFSKLAMEPIYENGKLSSLLIKELSATEQKEALSCLEKAIELGHWGASYTLHDFYKHETHILGIEKDLNKSKYYYNKYLELRAISENKPNNTFKKDAKKQAPFN